MPSTNTNKYKLRKLPTRLGSRSPKPVASLRWIDHRGRVRERFLREGDTCLIGRDRINEIVIKNSFISRRHAIIAWHDDGFEIADLGSKNGTFVNDAMAFRPIKLEGGDVIRLYAVKMVYEVMG